MEELQSTLKKLKRTAAELAAVLVKIDDDRDRILGEISQTYSVQDPAPIYDKTYDELMEGLDECMMADKFFVQNNKGFVADKTKTFLYDLWTGDYYGDCSENQAFLRFCSELADKKSLDFLEECAKYSR